MNRLEFPEHLKRRIDWDDYLKLWMADPELEIRIPIRGRSVPLGLAEGDVKSFHEWISSWKDHDVNWGDVKKGRFGIVNVPFEFSPKSFQELSSWVGRSEDYDRIKMALSRLSDLGVNVDQLVSIRTSILSLEGRDADILCALISWRKAEILPAWPRMIQIHDMDSKWIERNITLVDAVFSAAGIRFEGESRMAKCGFLEEDGLEMRFHLPGGSFPLSRFSCPPQDFQDFPSGIHTLVVVENRTSFRILRPEPGIAIALGDGRAVEAALPSLPASARLNIIYWGDCDSYGYAILNNLRSRFPGITSIGMGIEDVIRNERMAVPEPEAARIDHDMPNLTVDEGQARNHLLKNRLRLEQEFVSPGHIPGSSGSMRASRS